MVKLQLYLEDAIFTPIFKILVRALNGSTLHRHVSIIIVREFVFYVSTQVGHNLFMEIFIYKQGPGSLYEACSRLVTLPQTPHFYIVKLGVIRDIFIIVCAFSLKHMSRVVRKLAFCIREN